MRTVFEAEIQTKCEQIRLALRRARPIAIVDVILPFTFNSIRRDYTKVHLKRRYVQVLLGVERNYAWILLYFATSTTLESTYNNTL